MARLEDFSQFSFAGGVRQDKSPLELGNDELQRGRNFELDERGRIIKRRGSIQVGQTLSGNIIGLHYDPNGFLACNDETPAIVYKLTTATNRGALTTSTTTIVLSSSTGFAASGNAEIEGDLFSYTGVSGNTLTGVTGLTSSHAAGTAVHQWNSIGTLTGAEGAAGVWFSYLNSLTIIVFRNTVTFTYDGATATAMSDVDRPKSMFAENFRDRLYTVGDGSASNKQDRTFFSDLGDATSWTSGNNYDIEDNYGETITCIRTYHRNLLEFKASSFYAFPGSLPLRQISSSYGVYSDNALQEINGTLYGVGPKGVFATNGSAVTNIGHPVEAYLQDFNNQLRSSTLLVSNLHTGQWDNKFLIWMDGATSVETLTGAMLVYDTVGKAWEVHADWAGLASMFSTRRFIDGNALTQSRKALFWGGNGKVWRAYENRHGETDINSPSVTARGSNLYSDLFSNTGSAISMNVVFKPYEINTPNTYKQFKYLRVYSETTGIKVSCQIDGGQVRELGYTTSIGSDRFAFPSDCKGFRCAPIIDESSVIGPVIFNGFIFEETESITKNVP